MSTRQPDDAASIVASRSRPESFDEVFRRHFADVYRFAARHLGESEGEEVAAETFARAFAHRARFDSQGSARAWLFGICLNVVRDRRAAARGAGGRTLAPTNRTRVAAITAQPTRHSTPGACEDSCSRHLAGCDRPSAMSSCSTPSPG